MTAPTTVRAALAAMLKATAPGEAGLPEAEQLGAVRPVARAALDEAYNASYRLASSSDPVGGVRLGVLFYPNAAWSALAAMLNATPGAWVDPSRYRLVEARVAAHAALAEPEPDTAADPCTPVGRWVTAREFRWHQTQVAGGAS